MTADMVSTDSTSTTDIRKSRSDSEIISSHPPSHKSLNHSARHIFIDDISTVESLPGDRVWATCSGAGEPTDAISIHFLGDNFEESAVDITRKSTLVMFTVPPLKLDQDTEIELRFATSDENVTAIPFKYKCSKPIVNRVEVSLFDNLVEFATNGDTIALLQPFVEDIGKVDVEGSTVLHISAKNGQSFSLKLLLSVIPDAIKSTIINIQDNHGLTSLHCAIRAGDPDAVHYLMNHGARIDISDAYGSTALHYLGDAYNESIFKEILEPSRGQKFDINQLNNEGYAPIHVAVRRLKLSLIEMLLEAGALIDLLDGEKKRNALMHAVEMNDFETIQILVERGADTNIEDENCDTALSLAVKNVNYPVIGLLLDNKADPNRQNKRGVCLADSDDHIIQNIINGDRPELPKKDGFAIPNDLAISRSPLFGRSHPHNTPDEEAARNRVVKKSREEILNDAQLLLDSEDTPRPPPRILDEGPSTSAGPSRSRPETSDFDKKKMKDNVCNLDYLTRIRVSKIFDDQSKWQILADKLHCDHMIELISICSAGDESSPTMILLDQYEQMPESSINSLRSAMNDMEEEEGVKLIDSRYVY